MSPIFVLVVDDSLTLRKHPAKLLSANPELQVVGEGTDGCLLTGISRDNSQGLLAMLSSDDIAGRQR